MIAWILGNTVLAALGALVVALVCRWQRHRPELCHGLWLLVFALLITPPLPIAGLPGQALRSSVEATFAGSEELTLTPSPTPSGLALRPVPLSLRPEAPAPELPLNLDLSASTLLAPLPALRQAASWPIHPAMAGGCAIALFALLAGYLFMHRVARFHSQVKAAPRAHHADPSLQAAIERVARRLGVTVPEVRLVPGIGSPAVWCLGRARLLWPAADRKTPKQKLRSLAHKPSVIAHELAHIARRDTWVARLEPIAIALLFWNPLFWLIRNRVHSYAELSCDAWALWAYPEERRAYAEALVDSHEQNRTAALAVRGLCATHPNVKDLERRLTLIMKQKVTRGNSRLILTAAAALAITIAPGLSQEAVHDLTLDNKAHAQKPKLHDQITELKNQTAGGKVLTATQDPVDGEAYRLAELGYLDDQNSPFQNIIVDDVTSASTAKAEAAVAKAINIAIKAMKAGEMDKALQSYAEVIKLQPDHGEAYAQIAYILIGQGQHDGARKHLKQQLEIGYRPDLAYYNFACCDALTGNLDAAVQNLSGALSVGFADANLMSTDTDLNALHGMRSFDAAVQLCKILGAKLKVIESAEGAERFEALKVAAQIASKKGDLYRDLGMAYHMQGDYKNSLQAWKQQAALKFEPGLATYNIGCALARLGKADAAIDSLMQAADMGFSYPEASEDSDHDSLKKHPLYNKVIEALSVRSDFILELEDLMQSGEYDRASDEIEWLLAEENLDSEARGWANMVSGDIKQALGAYEEARIAYERALCADYDKSKVATELAKVLGDMGRVEEAMEQMRVAEMYARENQKLIEVDSINFDSDLARALGSVHLQDLADLELESIDKQELLELISGAHGLDVAEVHDLEHEHQVVENQNITTDKLLLELAQVRNALDVQRTEAETLKRVIEMQLHESLAPKANDIKRLKQVIEVSEERQNLHEHDAALNELDVELRRTEAELLELKQRRASLEQERAHIKAASQAEQTQKLEIELKAKAVDAKANAMDVKTKAIEAKKQAAKKSPQ